MKATQGNHGSTYQDLLFSLFFMAFGTTAMAASFSDYINNNPAENAAVDTESPASSNADSNTPTEGRHHHHKSADNTDTDASSTTNADTSDQKDAAVVEGIPMDWQTCGADSDCTAAVVDCLTWDPVNKKYLSKLSNWDSCSESIDPGFQPQAVCSHNRCRTTDNTTSVSWPEWLANMRAQKQENAP
jgi:hypothetical protein